MMGGGLARAVPVRLCGAADPACRARAHTHDASACARAARCLRPPLAGSLMIMADQDHDGSHIKGLVINFLHHFWPSLLGLAGFLREFITPIVKVVKGKSSTSFFTLPEYIAWKTATGAASGAGTKGWAIKYYKGLGTSTSVGACGCGRWLAGGRGLACHSLEGVGGRGGGVAMPLPLTSRALVPTLSASLPPDAPVEAKEYFAAIDKHQLDFEMDDPTVTGANASEWGRSARASTTAGACRTAAAARCVTPTPRALALLWLSAPLVQTT